MTDALPAVLITGKVNQRVLERLGDKVEVVHAPPGGAADLPAETAARIRAIAVTGKLGTDLVDALPALEIIANFGVGYDGVNVKHAAARGLTVTNTPEVLNDEVADTAVALLINTVRRLPQAEDWLRKGKWAAEGPFPLSPLSLRDRKVGILGLGRIGLEIARRLEPFKVKIGYHTRNPRDSLPFTWYETLKEMADEVDTLISIVPGTPETHKILDADIFRALGPQGVFINVGRGSTVDETALIAALENGTIAAAGLDVFYDEPNVPQALIDLPNVTLLPHVASASIPTRNAMADLVADNILQWLETGRAITPVPETPHRA